MTKILILGGSGILSLDVLNEGLRRSYDITCITRGIRDYRLPRGVNIIHGDVNKLDGVVDGLDNNYDAIFDFLSFDVKGLKYKLDYWLQNVNSISLFLHLLHIVLKMRLLLRIQN